MSQRQVELRQGYVQALDSLSTGTYKDSGDIIDYSVYDRLDMLSTTLEHQLFVTGVGGNDPAGNIKTLADTNLVGSNGLPVGQKLYVNALKIFYTSTDVEGWDAADINALQEMIEQTTLTIEISGKANYGQWKLNEILGVPVQGQGVVAALGQLASYGRFLGIYPLNLPIVLAQQVNFRVIVEHHAAASDLLDGDWMTISLSGILERLS